MASPVRAARRVLEKAKHKILKIFTRFHDWSSFLNYLNYARVAKYSISCRGVGVPDCDFEVKSASSEQELFSILKTHAQMGHNMSSIPPDKMEAARKAMIVQ
jgi:predicted small metal-binding protein